MTIRVSPRRRHTSRACENLLARRPAVRRRAGTSARREELQPREFVNDDRAVRQFRRAEPWPPRVELLVLIVAQATEIKEGAFVNAEKRRGAAERAVLDDANASAIANRRLREPALGSRGRKQAATALREDSEGEPSQ